MFRRVGPSQEALPPSSEKLRHSGPRYPGPPSWVGVALLGLAFAACGRPPPSKFPTAELAVERMRATTSCSRAVQGEATLDYFGAGSRVRGKLLYLAAAPAQVRFDIFSPFGVTVSTLTSDGERFALYDLQQKTFFHGPATSCNVERFTRVPVAPFALVELLRGRAPVLAHSPGGAAIEWSSDLFGGGEYLLKFRGAHQAQQEVALVPHPDDWDLPYEKQRVRVLEVTLWQAGQELYHVELDDYSPARRRSTAATPEERALGLMPPPPSGPVCSAELPGRVSISVDSTGQKLVFRNEEVWHNPPLALDAFRQAIPGGVTVRESICRD